MTVVAAAQLHLAVGEVKANRRAGLDAVAAAAGAGADLVVLPELSDTGYVLAGRHEALALADADATLGAWVAAAARHEIVVVGGYCERHGDEVANAAAIVDGSGVLARYRKAHLWDLEQEVFTAGSSPPPVVETAAGRVGVVVCYDLEFPEWPRMAAEGGADVLAVPTNWPRSDRPAGERPVEVVLAQAVAALNRVVVVAADRCGTERGVAWVGGSAIVGQDGYLQAGPVAADHPELLLAEVDPLASRDKRCGPRNDRLADRRPALYRA